MINQIGPVPSPLDSQSVFNEKAFALLAQFPGFVDETNQTAQTMQINADVAAALILAMALPQFAGTSTSSVTVGTGARTFATQAGKGWLPGQIVVASSGANYVKGTVTDYTGTDLELNVTSINGSGTYAAWNIGLSYDGLALAKSGPNNDITSLTGLVGNGLLPVGSVIFHAANSAPTGYLKANGALVSRTTYAGLFAVIGTTFGVGDGFTTFALPDFRGEFVRGWDDVRGIDSGRVIGSGQLDQMQGHGHTAAALSSGTQVPSYGPGAPVSTGSQAALAPITDGTNGTPRVGSETRPRNVALLACIKF